MNIFIVTVLAVVLVDQLSKFRVSKKVKGKNKIEIIKERLYFIYTENEGAFLGFLSKRKKLLKFISLVSIVLVILFFVQSNEYKNSLFSALAFGFFVGGGISNFLDRLLKGKVIDFIFFNIKKWPIFNLADLFIFAGMGIIIVNEMLH